jgi:hypothetical protein
LDVGVCTNASKPRLKGEEKNVQIPEVSGQISLECSVMSRKERKLKSVVGGVNLGKLECLYRGE